MMIFTKSFVVRIKFEVMDLNEFPCQKDTTGQLLAQMNLIVRDYVRENVYS